MLLFLAPEPCALAGLLYPLRRPADASLAVSAANGSCKLRHPVAKARRSSRLSVLLPDKPGVAPHGVLDSR